MARVQKGLQILYFFVYLSLAYSISGDIDSVVRELNEDNWKDILDGEWMVEFYAPWCPACNALQPAWRDLSMRAADKSVRTGAVDVTLAPGLSGRFVVTALPTIYHVKYGEFRQYKGPRDVDAMLSYVTAERWRQTEPVPSWKAPDSVQMSLVAYFFKLSQALRSVHTMLMETYGLPTWGSYLIFAVATIFIGALLGLVLVCFIDLLYPPKRTMEKVPISKADVDRMAKGDVDLQEKLDEAELEDDLVDDEEQGNDSDAEKNSGSDTHSSDNENTASQKTSSEDTVVKAEAGDAEKKDQSDQEDAKASPSNTEVRKRRPRKAD